MHARRQELIDCHDCGRAVSFLANSCPHCGSPEPSGPYVHSKKELWRLRIEQRNDTNLLVTMAACAGGGALYGALLGGAGLWSILGGLFYGVVGLLVGVPVAFAINITRGLLR
jgi:hypothetical protein